MGGGCSSLKLPGDAEILGGGGAGGGLQEREHSTLSHQESSKQPERRNSRIHPPREAETCRVASKRARHGAREPTLPPLALPQDQQRALQPSPHLQEHARLGRRGHGGRPDGGPSPPAAGPGAPLHVRLKHRQPRGGRDSGIGSLG